MDSKQTTRMVIVLLVTSFILAVAVITGLGLETRDISVFPSWQASLFKYGGLAVFITTILAAGTIYRWVKIGAPLAIISALVSLILSIVGVALFGAPAAPLGVVVIDIIHIIVALAIVYFAAILWRQRLQKTPSTPPP
jgi:hypothetical protein